MRELEFVAAAYRLVKAFNGVGEPAHFVTASMNFANGLTLDPPVVIVVCGKSGNAFYREFVGATLESCFESAHTAIWTAHELNLQRLRDTAAVLGFEP